MERGKWITWVGGFFLLLGTAQFASATPAQVLIIRHGEKPDTGHSLSEKGRARAQALVSFFEHSTEVTRFGTPAAIYAARKKNDPEFRTIETVQPLADDLGIEINTSYKKKEYEELATEILNSPEYEGKMVLICWQHGQIPYLAQALGAKSAPEAWSPDVFDRVWEIDYSGGSVSGFRDLPQNVLPGDSPKL